ncbi:MAG: polysaccharide biosynthesis/export family protein, partial [Nitrospirales bacterium]
PLPKGDVYADETVVPAGTPIEPGDTLEIVVRRGTGEEVYTSAVAQDGRVRAGFLDVLVTGLTAPQAEQEIQEKLAPYMRDPRVQVQLKKKLLKVKRVFVFGDVKEPGMYPLARDMTVLQAVASAKNYNETALLDEIRVIRVDEERPKILVADLARLLTYGDWSHNLTLQENDIVFVPRERLGDASEAAKKLLPIISIALGPLYATGLFATFAQ